MATGARIRVVLFITELALGGTPRRVQALAKGLRERGRFDPYVLSLMSGGAVAAAIESAGVPVETLGVRSKLDLGALFRLRGYLRRVRPSVLHAFNFHANLLAKLAGKLWARVPVVVVSEASVESAKAWWRVAVDRLTGPLADAHYANAEAVRKTLMERERVPPDRIWTVPTGVDTKAFSPQPPDEALRAELGIRPDERVVTSVGRLDKYKGQEFLLTTLHLATMSGHPYRLILVGDGRRRRALKHKAKSLGIADRVVFAGAQQDVRKYLAVANLFALASTEEGLPGSVLEAMSMGTPCLVTPTGGVTEVVIPGQTGYVAPRDPEAFAARISEILGDQEMAEAVRQPAREHVEQSFNLESMLQRTEKMYADLLGGAALEAPAA